MPMARIFFALGLLGLFAGARVAATDWQPQWSALVERGEQDSNIGVIVVHADASGAVFVGGEFNRDNHKHGARLRFENDGRFAWMHEHAVGDTAGVELLADGRFAEVGVSFDAVYTVFVRVYDGGSGDLIWERGSTLGRLDLDERGRASALAQSPSGDLLVRLSDPATGDYVVVRYAADGSDLAPWRWHAGADARASAIAALADGGAVVTGIGDALDGGYASVRFDASGNVLFHDLEPGAHGSPLGPAFVAVAADGGIVLAGTPEASPLGVPEATIWKLDADGARAWTTVLGVSDDFPLGRDLAAFALTGDGGVLVATDATFDRGSGYRLVRLAVEDGHLDWMAPLSFSNGLFTGTLHALAAGDGGRILGVGRVNSEDLPFARAIELTADGAACRSHDDSALFHWQAATAGSQGWTLAGPASTGIVVQRFDATGACDGAADVVFVDGFEPSAQHGNE